MIWSESGWIGHACGHHSFFAKLERGTIFCKAPVRQVLSTSLIKYYPQRTLIEETSSVGRVNKRSKGTKCLKAYPRPYDDEIPHIDQLQAKDCGELTGSATNQQPLASL